MAGSAKDGDFHRVGPLVWSIELGAVTLPKNSMPVNLSYYFALAQANRRMASAALFLAILPSRGCPRCEHAF